MRLPLPVVGNRILAAIAFAALVGVSIFAAIIYTVLTAVSRLAGLIIPIVLVAVLMTGCNGASTREHYRVAPPLIQRPHIHSHIERERLDNA